MNRRDRNQKNRGYSLVEMIIVIAIIVVMTGVAMVTVTLINSARAKEASVTFDSVLSDTITKAKTQIAVVDGYKQPAYGRCVWVHSVDGKAYMKVGFYNPNETGNARFVFDAADDTAGSGLSSRVIITYTEPGGTEADIDADGVYIAFDQMGRCVSGDGEYTFYKKRGNGNKSSSISYLKIQKNGSHIVK